jgi:hypothetical protein
MSEPSPVTTTAKPSAVNNFWASRFDGILKVGHIF